MHKHFELKEREKIDNVDVMVFLFFILFIFIYLFILGPHLQHMEVPRLGTESEQ